MASVSTPNPAGVFHEGRGNRILSVAPIETVMVRYSDPDGKESMALCYVFGEAEYKGLKDLADPRKPRRMAGVWIGANLQQLQNQLRLASGDQALAIINMLEEKGVLREGRVLGTAQVAPVAPPPDFSDAFDLSADGSAKKADDDSGEG